MPAATMNRVFRIDTVARIGFAMRAVLYILLGSLALDDAASHGTESAFDALRRVPGGREAAVGGAIGLLCFASFQIADGVFNLDDRDSRMKGWASRIGRVGTGLAYGLIAIVGGKLAIVGGNAGSGHAGARASSIAMHGSGGGMLGATVGLGFMIGAIDQFVKAITASFRRQLQSETPRFAIVLGRIGFAGHAVIIAVLAYLIVRAGLTERAQPLGIGPAIDELRRLGWIYQIVALSLIGFGIFSLFQSWYRRIDDRSVFKALDGKRPGVQRRSPS